MAKPDYQKEITRLREELAAYEYMQKNGLRPYGWRGFGYGKDQGFGRILCLAPSRAAIERALGKKIDTNSECFCETGNMREILALVEAGPMVFLWHKDIFNGEIVPAELRLKK